VTSVTEARPLALGVSQEALDVDFSLQLVHTSKVSGHVMNPDGSVTTSGIVNLIPDVGGTAGRGQLGVNFGGRIDWDGAFAIANVPPGRYTLRARADDTVVPEFAAQPLAVGSGDVANLVLVLTPGATITGTTTFAGTDPPDVTQIRISAPSLEAGMPGQGNGRVDKDGRFTLDGVPVGSHLLRAAGPLRGWSLKSVLIDGRDMIDTPIDLRSGQTLANVNLVFTNKISAINGTVTNEQGAPITDLTVLAFPTDSSLWRPQARQIATARPDQNGKFQIRALPPGEYYVVTIDPAEQGEWFEPAFLDQHRVGAARLTLGDGDVKTQDFRLNTK
jgi:Carboxypeptidase regulatory-like domain